MSWVETFPAHEHVERVLRHPGFRDKPRFEAVRKICAAVIYALGREPVEGEKFHIAGRDWEFVTWSVHELRKWCDYQHPLIVGERHIPLWGDLLP